ncbi:MAG TPA: lytic transglycosylase domain-containing protein [Rhizomicrobium sp.]|jgi:soluble lytic murein transglycosylase-like protein|nr:lytic transglycosylase domain-containing protein [Rhizomicrobium sp.]
MPTARHHDAGPAHRPPANPFLFPADIVPKFGLPAAARRNASHLVVAFVAAFLLIVAGSLASAEPVLARGGITATSADPFAAFVTEASQRFAIPASWIRAVMKAESFGDRRAISPKGAMGLMQIMPETWSALRVRYGLGSNPYDPRDNILAGAAYLRELHDRYGSPGFLAAYNAGPARYESYLTTGRALPSETQSYVAQLAAMTSMDTPPAATSAVLTVPSWANAPLFAERMPAGPTQSQTSSSSQPKRDSIGGPARDWTGLAPQSGNLFVRVIGRSAMP